MSNELAVVSSNVVPKQSVVLPQALIEQLMVKGDLSGLTPPQRTAYYAYRCQLLDLDPATQPFDLISLQGKLVLYAKKECANQLASKRQLSAIIIQQGAQPGDVYVVQARASAPGDTRVTDDLGAVNIKGLSGEALCNAMMKAATKAKRRAILGHCGLGMLDESELPGKGGWNDSGSKEEREKVKNEKLAAIERQRGSGDGSDKGGGSVLSASPEDSTMLDAAPVAPGSDPQPPADLAEDPIPETTKGKAKPKTANYLWLGKVKKLRDSMVDACDGNEERYYQLLREFGPGYQHSNQITAPAEQEKFLKLLQAQELYWTSRKAGGILFECPELTMSQSCHIYALGRQLKYNAAELDKVVMEALKEGKDADWVINWLDGMWKQVQERSK